MKTIKPIVVSPHIELVRDQYGDIAKKITDAGLAISVLPRYISSPEQIMGYRYIKILVIGDLPAWIVKYGLHYCISYREFEFMSPDTWVTYIIDTYASTQQDKPEDA